MNIRLEQQPRYSKFLIKLSGLIVVDFFLIWILVYYINPDPSVSIAVIFLVPIIFALNLVISGIFFWFRNKEFSRLLLINSIIAPLAMFYLFNKGIERYQNNRLESWEFNISDTTFSLTRWKEQNEFSMAYSTSPGSSTEFLHGTCQFAINGWILNVDSFNMKLYNDSLIGFRRSSDTLKMKKIKYND